MTRVVDDLLKGMNTLSVIKIIGMLRNVFGGLMFL